MSRTSSVRPGHAHGAADRRTAAGRRAAARRAAARRARLRNRLLLAAGAVLAVVAITVTLVLVRTGTPGGVSAPPSDGPTGPALAAVAHDLTTVPASTLDAVGGGSLATADIGSATAVGGGYLAPVTGPPLTNGGKPEVLYVGAGFCPYCAAVRWPLIVSLSRFGSFSGLTPDRSAVTAGSGQQEPYPATPTWTFYGSSYASRYVAFTPVETSSAVPDRATGGYVELQVPTAAQQATLARYDVSNAIPFIDIGNRYVQMSVLSPYGPQDLAGKTWGQIAAAVRDPSSALGQAIDASANYITAAICTLTGNQPASACTQAVRALQPRLG